MYVSIHSLNWGRSATPDVLKPSIEQANGNVLDKSEKCKTAQKSFQLFAKFSTYQRFPLVSWCHFGKAELSYSYGNPCRSTSQNNHEQIRRFGNLRLPSSVNNGTTSKGV